MNGTFDYLIFPLSDITFSPKHHLPSNKGKLTIYKFTTVRLKTLMLCTELFKIYCINTTALQEGMYN